MTPTTSTPATFHGNRVDQQFIAGQWRDGASGDRASDINPYTDDVVAEFALATAEDLDEAYRAAAAAQEEWAATPPRDRAAVLRRAAEILEERRGEVIDYVTDKYGEDKVAQIVTFGTMAARAVIRDVGRVLDMSYMFCDGISKLIPNKPGQPVTIQYPSPCGRASSETAATPAGNRPAAEPWKTASPASR